MQFRTYSEAETMQLGEKLAGWLEPGSIVLLTGDLGAGKTVFTKGIAAGLGVEEVVTSPSFTLMQRYQGRLVLYHFDLYRLEEPEELLELGIEDFLHGEGVSVVEWCERLDHPPDTYLQAALKFAYSAGAGGRAGPNNNHVDTVNNDNTYEDAANCGSSTHEAAAKRGDTHKDVIKHANARILEFTPRGEPYRRILNQMRSTRK